MCTAAVSPASVAMECFVYGVVGIPVVVEVDGIPAPAVVEVVGVPAVPPPTAVVGVVFVADVEVRIEV